MAPEVNQEIFRGAINPTIHCGTFDIAGRDNVHIHSSGSKRYGLELLIANMTQGAFHDAAERGDPPRCHPGTRSTILETIMEWVSAPEAHRKFILWLYGPAGAGKSAILQSIAEECEKARLLAASFFFGRTAAGRNDSSRVVATLAYQLSRSIPEICEPILSTIEKDPTIFSRAIAVQMRALVIAPLVSLTGPSQKPRVVVMDGVDECGPNGKAQVELLDVIGATVSELQHVPIIFLIGSRPEYEIRLSFNMNPLSSLMKGLVLDANYKPNSDIKIYLKSKFREIRNKQRMLGTPLTSPWPMQRDVDRLVERSSGQFIFASTAIKFVNSGRDPAKSLNIILGLSDPGKETPFAQLDTLYRHILSSVEDLPKVMEVLTLLILDDSYSYMLVVDVVDELLDLEVRRVLADMHALVYVPPPTDPKSSLRIHHASLYDFLMDPSRSRDFFVDAKQGHITIGQRWLKMVANYTPSKRYEKYGLYAQIRTVERHCRKLPNGELSDHLASFDLGALLEKMRGHTDLYDVEWDKFMIVCQEEQAKNPRADIFPRLQDQLHNFILEQLSQYPSSIQTYIPILFLITSKLLGYNSMVQNFFLILLHGVCQSEEEFAQIQELDGRLLNIKNFRSNDFFCAFFEDEMESKQCIVRNYVALVKQIITLVYTRSGEVNHYIAAEDVEILLPDESLIANDNLSPTFDLAHDIFVPRLLDDAPANLDVAYFLREHVLPYRYGKYSLRPNIALASLRYVQKCGLPYLEHTHPPDTETCIICEDAGDTYDSPTPESDLDDFSPCPSPSPDPESSHNGVAVSLTSDEVNRASPTLTTQSEVPYADVIPSNNQNHGRDQDEELDPLVTQLSIGTAEASIKPKSAPRKRRKSTKSSVSDSPQRSKRRTDRTIPDSEAFPSRRGAPSDMSMIHHLAFIEPWLNIKQRQKSKF